MNFSIRAFLNSNRCKDRSPVRRPGNTCKTMGGSAKICLLRDSSIRVERSSRQSSALEKKTWTKELDMYPNLVVDTSQRNDFHADVSVANYDDARLPYPVRYFLEFKLPSVEPRTAAHCGQMLDYFKNLREKQPHRSRFIGVLSNYSSTATVVIFVFHRVSLTTTGHLCCLVLQSFLNTSPFLVLLSWPPTNQHLLLEASEVVHLEIYFLRLKSVYLR